MPYLFIAQIRLDDPEGYQKYIHKSEEVFKKYNGKYIAVDNNPLLLEGAWDYSRTVVIKFKTKNDFQDWYYSSEYQEILKHRLAASHSDAILVNTLH